MPDTDTSYFVYFTSDIALTVITESCIFIKELEKTFVESLCFIRYHNCNLDIMVLKSCRTKAMCILKYHLTNNIIDK